MEWRWRVFVAPRNAPTPRPHENWISGGSVRSAEPRAEPAPESGVAADHLPGPQNSLEVADAASQNSTGDEALDHSFLLFLLLLLLPGQNQELRVGRENFANGVLKLPSGAHPAAALLGPLGGDAFHVPFPVNRVSQGPRQMSFTAGTMTAGLSAACITPRESPR